MRNSVPKKASTMADGLSGFPAGLGSSSSKHAHAFLVQPVQPTPEDFLHQRLLGTESGNLPPPD
jgi:hypothetical protein